MSQKEEIVIPDLGPCEMHSPLRRDARGTMEGTFVSDSTYVRLPIEIDTAAAGASQLFEKAGPRENIFFDPSRTKAAIVTCGGLCPGLNNVIRSVYLQLHFHYGVNAVLGIRYGYAGFAPEAAASPVWLNTEMVNDIHQRGGTLLRLFRADLFAPVFHHLAIGRNSLLGIQTPAMNLGLGGPDFIATILGINGRNYRSNRRNLLRLGHKTDTSRLLADL